MRISLVIREILFGKQCMYRIAVNLFRNREDSRDTCDRTTVVFDTLQPMIEGKHVLLLIASATTGKTIKKSLECIKYYGGSIAGISAIFSVASREKAEEQFQTAKLVIGEVKKYLEE